MGPQTLVWGQGFESEGFPGGLSSKKSTHQCGGCGFGPWVGKIPLEEEMATHAKILA